MLVVLIPPLGLTPAQYEIALLAMDGMSNTAIATALGVSINTVKEHLQAAFSSLGIKTRTQLAIKLWWELEGKYKGGE